MTALTAFFADHNTALTVLTTVISVILTGVYYVYKSRNADDWAIKLFVELLSSKSNAEPLHGNVTVVVPPAANKSASPSSRKGVTKELKFGDGSGKPVRLIVDDVRFFSACIAEGSLGLGESYMNGWFHFENSNLYDFVSFLLRNRIKERILAMLTLSHKLRGLRTWLHYKLAGHEQALYEHYGVNEDLYKAMLGEYMVYSCPMVPSISFPAEKAKKLGVPPVLHHRFYSVDESETKTNGHSNGHASNGHSNGNSNGHSNGKASNGKTAPSAAEASSALYHPLDEAHFPLSELNLDLDAMQDEKLRRICEKLQLRPGQRMLDIGSGFGGLCIFAAKNFGVYSTGFSLTETHVRIAREQAVRIGAKTTTFHHRDLSIMKEFPDHSFDAIVSIGVFEHIHGHEYNYVFQQIKRLLTPNGTCLLHAISSPRLPLDPDPFIQRYIFMNSRQIVLSQMANQLEHNELAVIDVENIGPHYSFALRFWLDRSLKFFEERAKAGKPYPERFIRMWDAYLSMGCAYSAHGDGSVLQILFHSNSCGQRALDRNAIHYKPLRA